MKLFFILILFALALLGCGGDDEILKDPVPVVKFVSATPPGGILPRMEVLGLPLTAPLGIPR